VSEAELGPDEAPYPPAPWQLRGSAVMVGVPVRAAAATALGLPPRVRLLRAGGRALGGVLLASYGDGATLSYRELIAFGGLARAGGRLGFVVSGIWVDLPASVAGGRRIWGLPKHLARFDGTAPPDGWSEVRRDDELLLRARVRRRRGLSMRLPLAPATFGERDGELVWAATRGWLRAAPALVRLEVPPSSPLAGLGLSGTWAGLAGSDLDLPFPGPRPVAAI
jgi:hypothetical protein